MNLRAAAYTAGRWTTASTLLRAVIQLIQVMILARLLVPADFGLMAMAGVAVAIVSLFADLGLASALIHFPTPSQHVLFKLLWLNIGVGLALAGLFALLAAPVSSLYGQPALTPVLLLLALVFPINAASQQLRALAEKGLRFPTLARIEVSASVFGFAIAIAFAHFGAGVYSLVAATLATASLGSVLVWWLLRLDARSPFTAAPAPDSIRSYLQFGGHRVGEQVWNTLRQQADIFIASVIAGPGLVAMYAVPREQSLQIANAVVNPVVTRVGLPVMARLQGDVPAMRAVYLQTMQFTASLNFPAYALLMCFSEEVVDILLGDQWRDAADYLRILAAWGLLRSTGNPSGSLLYAVGLVKRAHVWNLALLFATVPVLWFGARQGGLPGLAWTMLALQALIFVLAWRFLIQPACRAGFIEYLAPMVPPAVATLLSASLAWVLTLELPGHWRLLAGAIIMGAAYLLCSLLINRTWVRAMGTLLKPIFGKWPNRLT